MKKISVLLFLFVSVQLFAQKGNSFYVKVDIENKPIRDLFAQIETQLDATFSYNSRLINADSLVSYSSSGTLKKVITEVFNKQIQAKVVGDYIVLVPSKKADKKLEKTNPIEIVFEGSVFNARTNAPIKNVSIYSLSTRVSVLSDSEGRFKIKLVSGVESSLAIAKTGYKDLLVSVSVETENNLEYKMMALSPKLTVSTHTDKEKSLLKNTLIVPHLVPNEELMTANNLINVNEKRVWQVSLIPKLGTNLAASGVVDNQYSLNLLGGFNGGVEGVEVGGLFNIVKNDVWGFQLAGLTNIVGGKVEGFQVGGISNLVSENFTGLQVGGVYNYTAKKVVGAQFGGVINLCDDTLHGAQIVGIMNNNKKDVIGAQISGVYNKCEGDMTGLQFATIKNKVLGKMNGAQIGLINSAHQNNGFQFGLVNYADTAKGVSIGLFSFIKSGYHPIEVFGNEVLYANIAFKTGTDHFYTIYTMGVRPSQQEVFGAGVGVGTKINTWDWLSISVDATSTFINEYESAESDTTIELNLLNRLDVSLDFTLGKFSLFVGPALNLHVSQMGQAETGTFTTQIAIDPFYTEENNGTQIQAWVGGKAGLRFSF